MPPQQLPYAIACAKCKKQHAGEAENPFVFIEAAKTLGWTVPLALENKPIICPDCKP